MSGHRSGFPGQGGAQLWPSVANTPAGAQETLDPEGPGGHLSADCRQEQGPFPLTRKSTPDHTSASAGHLSAHRPEEHGALWPGDTVLRCGPGAPTRPPLTGEPVSLLRLGPRSGRWGGAGGGFLAMCSAPGAAWGPARVTHAPTPSGLSWPHAPDQSWCQDPLLRAPRTLCFPKWGSRAGRRGGSDGVPTWGAVPGTLDMLFESGQLSPLSRWFCPRVYNKDFSS